MWTVLSKCRICLEKKPEEELVPVSTPWQENASKSIKEIIIFCVPTVSIQDTSQICSSCMEQLKFAYFFIERCLLAERILSPNSSQPDKLLEHENIIIIIEDNENEYIAEDKDNRTTDKVELNHHSYIILSKNNEEINDQSDDSLNEAVEVVEDKENSKTSPQNKHQTSTTENATNSFPESILDIFNFAATKVMCLSARSDMTQENHDDLIRNGINVINMSRKTTKKKRVIYVGRDLEYKVQKCAECDWVFKTSCDYTDHAHLHHNGKIKLSDKVSFKCNQCDSEFDSNMAYRKHYRIAHYSLMPFPCKKCNRKFRVFKDLQRHTETYKDQEMCFFICQKCNKKFKRVKDLRRHQDIFKSQEQCSVSCPRCRKKFKTVTALQAHESDVADAPSCDYLKCGTCSQKFTKEDYKTHLSDHNPEYLCSQCGKGFYSSRALLTHQKNVHQQGSNMCPKCGKVMKPGWLRKHMANVHGTDIFMCDKCPKVFKSEGYLRKHRTIHDVRKKPHTCDKCKKRFFTKDGLSGHIRLMHSGEAKHVCPMCGEGLFRSDYLKRHIKFHEKYLNLSCKVCKMSFSTKSRLLTHEMHGHDENGKPLYIGREVASVFKWNNSGQYSREKNQELWNLTGLL
ncbi:unnamed protein product [Ceutorhynchus assimilis]|uniref:Zinc finger protein n=1 Tax=Ceutorhynchus assimilis TaxID=467358 RepID=A0A9P0GMT8_9CUCU|nr:unnamed protein product [Ceutorhynchus assimilis]